MARHPRHARPLVDGGKQPMAIAPASGEAMTFAGIWENWRSEGDEVVRTFAVVTTEANAPMRAVHDRMPVILAPGDWTEWLEGDDPAGLMRPAPDDLLRFWPVSKAVNSPRNNGPELLAEHVTAPDGGGEREVGRGVEERAPEHVGAAARAEDRHRVHEVPEHHLQRPGHGQPG